MQQGFMQQEIMHPSLHSLSIPLQILCFDCCISLSPAEFRVTLCHPLAGIQHAILLFFDSIAEQGQLASPVIMGKLHARVLYQINPSLLLAASACHHARATHICAGRNRVKVQNLRSLVSYLASHQIDTERCSRFFSQPFSQGLPHVVQGLQQPGG